MTYHGAFIVALMSVVLSLEILTNILFNKFICEIKFYRNEIEVSKDNKNIFKGGKYIYSHMVKNNDLN